MNGYCRSQKVSTSPKRNDDSLQPSTQESLRSLPPLCAPRFPKLSDLVDPRTFELVDPAPMVPPARLSGLFSALLQDHVELLADDVTAHPERFSPEAVKLIEELLQGQKNVKSLADREREILDRATLDFATFVPPKDAPSARTTTRAEKAKAKPADETEAPVPGVDTPSEAEAPAYWWLR
jgi:hypothetical protein